MKVIYSIDLLWIIVAQLCNLREKKLSDAVHGFDLFFGASIQIWTVLFKYCREKCLPNIVSRIIFSCYFMYNGLRRQLSPINVIIWSLKHNKILCYTSDKGLDKNKWKYTSQHLKKKELSATPLSIIFVLLNRLDFATTSNTYKRPLINFHNKLSLWSEIGETVVYGENSNCWQTKLRKNPN